VEQVVPNAEVERERRTWFPLILDVGREPAVLRVAVDGRKVRGEQNRILQRGDRRRIAGIERLVGRERPAPVRGVARRVILVRSAHVGGSEFHTVRARGHLEVVAEFPPPFLLYAAVVRPPREAWKVVHGRL